MSKSKTGVPPPPGTRDKLGRFVPGCKGSSKGAGGRPKLREEFKKFAQEKSFEALQTVFAIMMTGADKDKLVAARLMMEYGYGRPAAEYDRERIDIEHARLELDKRRSDVELNQSDGPKNIHIIVDPDAEDWGD